MKVRQFRQEHPELEPLWPDVGASRMAMAVDVVVVDGVGSRA
jgi:hypothetical protein